MHAQLPRLPGAKFMEPSHRPLKHLPVPCLFKGDLEFATEEVRANNKQARPPFVENKSKMIVPVRS